MEITISSEPLNVLNRECLVCTFFSDERPPRGYCGLVDWRFNGVISNYIKEGILTGTFMEKVLMTPNHRIPPAKILLFGLGDSTHLTYDRLYDAGVTISHTVTRIHCGDTAFDIPGPERCNLEVAKMTTAMISGFTEASIHEHSDPVSLSAYVIGYDSYRDEITLGANQFKVNVKDSIKVTIVEV